MVQFICKVHLSFTLFTQSANLIFRSGQLGLRHSLLQQDSLDPREETCSARFWGHLWEENTMLVFSICCHTVYILKQPSFWTGVFKFWSNTSLGFFFFVAVLFDGLKNPAICMLLIKKYPLIFITVSYSKQMLWHSGTLKCNSYYSTAPT